MFQEDRKVLEVKKKEADEWPAYFTILQDPESKIIKLYYSTSLSHKNLISFKKMTMYSESLDGINFSIPKKILELDAASSNFHVFLDPKDAEYRYKAVGGQNLREHHHNMINCNNRNFIKIKNQKFTNPDKGIHTCHAGGIYLFKSKDGVIWEKARKNPIIKGNHKGQKDGMWGINEYDGCLSVIFNKKDNLYYLYCRLNIKGGVRYIQYCSSKDLIEWSEFKEIKTNFSFNRNKDNFYYPHFFTYKEMLYGMTAYYEEGNDKQKKAGLLFLQGESPGKWNVVSTIKKTGFFNKEPHGKKSSRFKNEDHTVNGIVEIEGEKFIYIHTNYYNFNTGKSSNVIRYKLLTV